MRLLMFASEHRPRLGALHGDHVIDIAALARSRSLPAPPRTLLELVDAGEEGLGGLRQMLALVEDGHRDDEISHPYASVEPLSPFDPVRGSVVAVGRNYLEHAAELARAAEGKLNTITFFCKAPTSVIGPNSDIPIDFDVSSQMDWEAELGVVMGRTVKNVSEEDALGAVFGYTVINDITARDMQYGWGGQFFKGKSLDGTCPMGPCVVTSDEIPDPQDLRILLRVNGETKQDACTSTMVHPVRAIIAQLSLGMTVPAGTVIATGTPPGVGFARVPPEYLQDGDVMETEIDRIGMLRNRIIRPPLTNPPS